MPDFTAFLALALEEVEHDGTDSGQVQERIDRLLDDLASAARPEHSGAVLAARTRRAAGAARS